MLCKASSDPVTSLAQILSAARGFVNAGMQSSGVPPAAPDRRDTGVEMHLLTSLQEPPDEVTDAGVLE